MRLVFQVDSDDNLSFMFGDSGCGHITQCQHHKNQVAFAWTCLLYSTQQLLFWFLSYYFTLLIYRLLIILFFLKYT